MLSSRHPWHFWLRSASAAAILALGLALGLALSLALSPGCSSETNDAPDGASPDASRLDGGLDGGGGADAAPDAGEPADGGADAGPEVPLPGFGDIAGQCGVLEEPEWGDASPLLFRNVLDLGTVAFDASALSPGGQEIWVDGNLGGSSIHSEVFAYEVLRRCELADLLKTEGEIEYWDDGGKKTDLLVAIDSRKVGVSVTRAYHYPPGEPLTSAEAEALLQQKLGDVLLSEANARPVDAWHRSLLAVIAYDAQHGDAVAAAFAGLDPTVAADTIVVVTVTDGQDDYVY